MNNMANKKILIVMAHPDDGEFMAGAAIAHWAAQGADIYYSLMTNGDVGSSDPHMTSEALIELRRNEAQEAANRLGVQHPVIFFNQIDSQLTHTLDIRRDLTRVIRQIQPDVIVTQDPSTYYHDRGYINHPDHRAVGDITFAAIMPSASTRLIFPELLDEGLEPHRVSELLLVNTNHRDYWIEVTTEDIEKQRNALLAHATQVKEGPSLERLLQNAKSAAQEARVHGHFFEYAASFKCFLF